jgi:hypothetical protein
MIFILLILCPSITLSHPGKTDKRAGHKCWKDCYEWDLAYAEYHLHDKDFRPIRIGRDGNSKGQKEPPEIKDTIGPKTTGAAVPEDIVKKEPPKEKPQEIPVSANRYTYNESIYSFDPLYFILSALVLVLLLILLAIRVRERKGHQ